MKALLQLTVEINFDEIIDDNSIEQLKKFTGAQTKEGVGKYYLDSFAKSIIDNHLRQSHIAYSVEGSIVQTAEVTEPVQQDDVSVKDLSEYCMVDDVIGVEEECTASTIDVLEVAVKFLERVSIHKGLPECIKITAELFDKFVSETGSVEEDGKTTWFGINVYRIDEEYVMAIDYKSFDTGELETEYMHTLATTL